MGTNRLSGTLAIGFVFSAFLLLPSLCSSQEDMDPVTGLPRETQAGECADLSVLSRLPGSVIVSCDQEDSVEVTIPLKPDAQGHAQEKSVRGPYQSREYQLPQADQSQQAFDNLTSLVGISGFTIEYSSSPSTITARKQNTWILIQVNGESYDVEVVRSLDAKPSGPVNDFEEISQQMETHKRVAIYGIQFSPDNRTVVDENSKILGELLTYLKTNASLAVDVESHILSKDGTPEGDLAITRLRSEALVEWLVAHGIASRRLQPEGFGRSKPLTKNDTPADIQRNERIEIADAAQ